ncbi:hypothetical protein VTL71DRAFT_16254 [Oculimacula yallundae]|uniref:Uncharacterized protein n=1 Tax=Oculimacula yallundae TaxID=86028 RepID=A0ABR4CDX2_9HELO
MATARRHRTKALMNSKLCRVMNPKLCRVMWSSWYRRYSLGRSCIRSIHVDFDPNSFFHSFFLFDLQYSTVAAADAKRSSNDVNEWQTGKLQPSLRDRFDQDAQCLLRVSSPGFAKRRSKGGLQPRFASSLMAFSAHHLALSGQLMRFPCSRESRFLCLIILASSPAFIARSVNRHFDLNSSSLAEPSAAAPAYSTKVGNLNA